MDQKRIYISTLDDDNSVEMASIEDSAGIYSDRNTKKAALNVDGDIINLGYRDVTLSRLRSTGSPVQLNKVDGGVEIYNHDNKSEVHVSTLTRKQKLPKGKKAKLTSDCLVEPGINTQLRVTIDDVSYEEPPQDGDDIPPIQEINILCDVFANTVRNAPEEAESYGKQLQDTMQENPIESETFDKLKKTLHNILDDMSDGSGSIVVHADEVEELTSRIENLYNQKV